MTEDSKLVVVDGREALGYVMVRPAPTPEDPRKVSLEAFAHGVSKADMAHILRFVADKFAAEAAAELTGAQLPEQGGAPDAR
jgi:hypothetical protein